ncbi:MAG: hypothetical protein HRU05_07590 [Oceanospirillaceae bacterium]|nr:hypothetical protein [Oceanospirillaceae bacterium]
MIKNWINRKISAGQCKTALQEIEIFLGAIKAKDDQDVAMLVAIATLIRVNLAENGGLSKQVLAGEGSPMERKNSQLYVTNLVREFQKRGQPFDAAGGMVWLHSLKVQTYPELVEKVSELWIELKRGFPHVENKLAEIAELTGKKTPVTALKSYRYVPTGMAPGI